MIRKFVNCERGATLVEYGVALVLAVLLGGGALSFLGEDVGQNMDAAAAVMDDQTIFVSTNTAD